MDDVSADLIEKVRDELAGWPIGSGYYQASVGTDEARDMARAVLEALDLPGLLNAAKAEALLDLPVSLVEFVRASGRPQTQIARDAQITEKHLSRMLNHGEGRIDTWVRVLHAAGRIDPDEEGNDRG